MIKAAMVGLGWWGRTIVESVQSDSEIIRFVAGATRTKSPDVTAFAEAQKLKLADSFEALLGDPSIDAIVLATPHSMHSAQVIAAAQAGKHVFCEKPFALHKADADAAVAATKKAGVTLGLGYNRRFHPEMTALRQRIRVGRARRRRALRSDDDVSQRAGAQGRRAGARTATRRRAAA